MSGSIERKSSILFLEVKAFETEVIKRVNMINAAKEVVR